MWQKWLDRFRSRKQADESGRPTIDEALIPGERRFTVGEREIVLRPFTFATLERVEEEMGALIQEVVEKHPDLDLSEPGAAVATIVPTIRESILRVMGRVFDIEPDYLREHMPIYQIVEVVTAAIEVNRLPQMIADFIRARQMVKSVPKIG